MHQSSVASRAVVLNPAAVMVGAEPLWECMQACRELDRSADGG